MNTLDAISARKSVRAFTDKEVPDNLVDKIISIAKDAPTGGNMQPWQVVVVRGKTKQRLADAHIEVVAARENAQPEFNYYPDPMPPKYDLRRHHMGMRIYHANGIEFTSRRIDWQAIIKLVKQNYYFFGADVGLLFFIEPDLEAGSILDIGMFMQNIMLAAMEYDLATCAQASWGNYPKIVKDILGIGDDLHLICGMSLGYPAEDPHALLTHDRTDNGDFVRWYS